MVPAPCQWAAPLGFVAVLAGWTVTEVGRQPWTVYGLLRTAQSVTPSLTGVDVLGRCSSTWRSIDHVSGRLRGACARIIGRDRHTAVGRVGQIAHAHSTLRAGGAAVMSGGIPDLVPIWTVIIALAVFLYVLLDGFDLGVGILYGFAPAGGPRPR